MRSARTIPAPFVLLGGVGLALLVAGGALALVARTPVPTTVEVRIRFSQFETDRLTIPVGVPLTVVLVNDDPIDHEWIVGDAALHDRHRSGEEPVHDTRPTEVTIPALSQRTTTVTFDRAGRLTFICHLPGHEAYGMVGTLDVTAP